MYDPFRKFLFRLDPERAHRLTLHLLAMAGAVPAVRSGLRRIFSYEDPRLEVDAFGLKFRNPVGLAAGYDKDGVAIYGLACLGFGHLELGTVTLNAQNGNPQPRLFRLHEDQALINRMGFPNRGVTHLLDRIKSRPKDTVLGINIGKSSDTPIEQASEDYIRLMELVYQKADYLTINVSSPNTIGLRELQNRRYLEAFLGDLADARDQLEAEFGKRRPLLVKLAPDLNDSDLGEAVQVIQETRMDGIIATNTTVSRDNLRGNAQDETGGLSGSPLFQRSTDMIEKIKTASKGELPIIGVGGIFGPEHARKKLDAGAHLVQIYTGLVYRGPGLVREVLSSLH